MTSHPEIAGARCECPACRIERLEAELAEPDDVPEMTVEEMTGPPSDLVRKGVAHFKALRAAKKLAEPETPVTEATVTESFRFTDKQYDELEDILGKAFDEGWKTKDNGSSKSVRVADHVIDAARSWMEAFIARRKPDPSPELRERLAIAMFDRDAPSHIIDWEFYRNKERYLCLADAVLSALGEPK